jgi:formamidopyrimidine-DNA glycosylase
MPHSTIIRHVFFTDVENNCMPELPDLQVFSKNLNKKLKGKTVESVRVMNTKKIKIPVNKFQSAFKNAKLKEVERVGKELHFHFDNDNILGLHLMLHGGLKLFENDNDAKHTIIEINFTDGSGLAMTDFQGNATPTLNPEEKEAPDALSKEITVSFLKEALNKKASVKNILLDQKVIRGIGNAYADEILWEAGISPFSKGNAIPDDKIKALHKAIKSVLTDAEKQIIKSNADIISGEVRDFLKIHNAKKEKSPNGSKIIHKVVGGRKTYYTEEQEMYE